MAYQQAKPYGGIAIGVTLVVALAAIAVGIIALQAIQGHNVGPFHALTYLKPEGAWTLIGTGLAAPFAPIIYFTYRSCFFNKIKEVTGMNANLIFKNLRAAESTGAFRNVEPSQRKRFFVITSPCLECDKHESCPNPHTYIFFILAGNQEDILEINDERYIHSIQFLGNNNYEMCPFPKLESSSLS